MWTVQVFVCGDCMSLCEYRGLLWVFHFTPKVIKAGVLALLLTVVILRRLTQREKAVKVLFDMNE